MRNKAVTNRFRQNWIRFNSNWKLVLFSWHAHVRIGEDFYTRIYEYSSCFITLLFAIKWIYICQWHTNFSDNNARGKCSEASLVNCTPTRQLFSVIKTVHVFPQISRKSRINQPFYIFKFIYAKVFIQRTLFSLCFPFIIIFKSILWKIL